MVIAKFSCEITRDNGEPFSFPLDLSDDISVWEEAVFSMAELIKEFGKQLEPGQTIRLTVTDNSKSKRSISITVHAR